MFGVEVAEAERGELPAGGRGPPRPREAAEQSQGPRTNILMTWLDKQWNNETQLCKRKKYIC